MAILVHSSILNNVVPEVVVVAGVVPDLVAVSVVRRGAAPKKPEHAINQPHFQLAFHSRHHIGFFEIGIGMCDLGDEANGCKY